MELKRKYDWRIFFILLGACLFGVIAIIPYSLTLQGGVELARTRSPIPLELLILLQLIQNAAIFAVAIGLGLFFANRTGLGLPILEQALAKRPVGGQVRALLLPGIGLGLLASALVIGLDLLFQPLLLRELGALADLLASTTVQPPAWQGFLASFYGGIAEEVLLRLFLLSLLAWLGKFIAHTADGRPATAVLWTANILAALLFGVGHLPTMAQLAPLTPLMITRTILLNAVAGIFFGYLYFRRGLEAAMLSHFSADILLHVLLAL